MERSIPLLFRLMSASCILMGTSGFAKKEKIVDPFVLEEMDDNEIPSFSHEQVEPF